MSLPGHVEIVTTRHFPCDRDTLFSAFSDPRQLALWWGPHEFTNRITAFDLRAGGSWRIVMTSFDGTEFDNRWTFHAVEEPRRILAEHHEPMHVFTLEMLFEPEDDGARLTWRMYLEDNEQTREIDRFIAAANEQNFDRLEALLNGTAE